MKKFMCILLGSIFCIMLVACGSSDDHIGQAKTPSGSSIMKGKHYESVVGEFKENGFTNIKLEKIEDLIFGWITKEGEVEEVSVGGDFNYSSDKWVSDDTEVVIRYHAFPEEETEENTNKEAITKNDEQSIEEEVVEEEVVEEAVEDEVLTIENCEELRLMLSNGDGIDESYGVFATKYKGRTIEFDASIDYMANHKNYDTRYDIVVSTGDYDPVYRIGPVFKFENVEAYDLGLNTLYLENEIKVGKNVRVVAKVDEYDHFKSGFFYLDPISVTNR